MARSFEDSNGAPTAGSIGVSPAGLGLAVITNYTFTAQGATDPENAPLSYAWTFGDGASGSGVTAAHVYQTAGTFTVTLNVSDGSRSASTTTTVRVGDVNGTWVNIDPEPGYPGGIERRIRFEQSGTNLGGTYRISVAAGNTGSVTARLSPPRNIAFETKLKDQAGQWYAFTFTGTLSSDLEQFSAARIHVIGAMITHDPETIVDAGKAVDQVIARFEDKRNGGYFFAADKNWNITRPEKNLDKTSEIFGVLMHLYEVSYEDKYLLRALSFLDVALDHAWG